MRPRSLAFRLVAAAALWITAALAVGGVIISTLFRDSVVRSFDARLTVHLDSLIAVSELDDSGEIVLLRGLPDPRFELPYSGWYWQISNHSGRPLARSRSLWDQILDVPAPSEPGSMETRQAPAPDGGNLRFRIIDVTLPDQPTAAPPLRFAVAADTAELKAEIRPFNVTLGWALGVLGLGLAAAVAIQVRVGLRPLRRIRIALSDIRAGRSERMSGAWPAEVQPLARELDALLDHNAEVMDRARTHVGNLAHALKTPLAVLANEASRKGGPRADAVARQVSVMGRWIDHYLTRARAAATGTVLGARTAVGPVVEDLRRTLVRIHADKKLAVRVEVPDDLAFRGERQDIEEMLGNLLDNACKWADSTVTLTARADAGNLVVTIDDDGPGLPADRRAEAMSRGRRLDEAAPGSGLGLAIVADIAALYGGTLKLDASPAGGLRGILTLPVAEP